jgi:hypothetical protein
MHGYGTSQLLLLAAIILVVVAIALCIIAYQELRQNVVGHHNNTNIGFVQSVLLYLIVIFAIMLLFFCYGLVKVRSSNMGGIIMGILGLILVIIGIILASIAIYKVNYIPYAGVIKGLAWSIIILPVVFLFAVMSVYSKPKLTTINMGKKIVQATKDVFKSDQKSSADVDTGLIEVDGPIYVEAENTKKVKPIVRERVVEDTYVPSVAPATTTTTSTRRVATPRSSTRTIVVEE